MQICTSGALLLRTQRGELMRPHPRMGTYHLQDTFNKKELVLFFHVCVLVFVHDTAGEFKGSHLMQSNFGPIHFFLYYYHHLQD